MTKLRNTAQSRNGQASLEPGCSLTDCTLVIHRGSLYEPFHRRLTFVEEDGRVAYDLALDADGHLILQVETPVQDDTADGSISPRARRDAEFEARRLLATALHEHFRQQRALPKIQEVA